MLPTRNSLKSVSVFLIMLIISTTLLAQETKIELPTDNNSSNFTITGTDANKTMKFFADGGFYIKGTAGTGTIPIEGVGTRLMWYPAKAAFRAGYVYGTQWNDENIGDYSTALGYYTTASGNYSTAMGSSTTASGTSSTAMGCLTTASGRFSTAIGTRVIVKGEGSMYLSDHSTVTYTTVETPQRFVGRFANGYYLYTNSDVSAGVYIDAGGTSWSSVSDSTKKENFLYVDGEYFLESISKLKLCSWNYKAQDSSKFRHYGPMAQEIYHYFGKDKYGTIGNDTTLATQDMDGIMMIAIKALEKRTRQLRTENEDCKLKIADLKNENSHSAIRNLELEKKLLVVSNQYGVVCKENEEMKSEIAALKKEFEEMKKFVAEITSKNKAAKIARH